MELVAETEPQPHTLTYQSIYCEKGGEKCFHNVFLGIFPFLDANFSFPCANRVVLQFAILLLQNFRKNLVFHV